MEMDPHQLIEGIIIAGKASGASGIYLHSRRVPLRAGHHGRARSPKPMRAATSAKIFWAAASIST
jgi:hypothetical protein